MPHQEDVRESEVELTLALDNGEWSASHPCCFILDKKLWYIPWTGHWLGCWTGLDAVKKIKTSCLCQESNHDTSVMQIIVESLFYFFVVVFIGVVAIIIIIIIIIISSSSSSSSSSSRNRNRHSSFGHVSMPQAEQPRNQSSIPTRKFSKVSRPAQWPLPGRRGACWQLYLDFSLRLLGVVFNYPYGQFHPVLWGL